MRLRTQAASQMAGQEVRGGQVRRGRTEQEVPRQELVLGTQDSSPRLTLTRHSEGGSEAPILQMRS